MAIVYNFSCQECEYKEQIYIGITRGGAKKFELPPQLGSCTACGRLFGNKVKQCIYCLRIEPASFMVFNRFKIYIPNKDALKFPLRFYKENKVDNVPCPNCKHKYLKASPIVFYD